MPAHGEDEDQRADVCVCFHFLFLSSVSSFRFFFFYFYISIIYYVKEPKTENLFRIDQTNNGWLANGEWRMANDGFCGGGCAVQIVKVLGEGGFSFVYLAQDDLSRVSHVSFWCLFV